MIKELQVNHVSSYEGSRLLDEFVEGFEVNCELKNVSDKMCLFMTSNTFKWKPTEIKISYQDEEIENTKSTTKQFAINEQAILMINVKNIFLNLFEESFNRTFTVVINFQKDNKYQCCSTFQLTLPVISNQRYWDQLPLPLFCPDEITRAICQSNFKINESSTPKEIEKCILLEEFRRTDPKDRLRLFGYCSMLELMTKIEESYVFDLVDACHIDSQYVQQITKTTFKIETPYRVPECATSVRLFPIRFDGDSEYYQSKNITCRIIRYENNHIIIENKPSPYTFEEKKICTIFPYEISFTSNSYSSTVANLALKTIQKNGLESWMLDFDGTSTASVKIHHEFNWFNKNISTNAEQKLAVKNIVNKTSKAMPFVIFGPPGTGKTSTLVEAVLQIVTLNPNAKVLISVNSNSACDEIGERLIDFISVNKIYRFYAPALERKMDKVNPKLIPISNLRHGHNINPTHEELCSYNIVISTLVTCGKFISAEIDPKHFDYLFIDECASMAECYAAIPIAVCAQEDKMTTQLVLCGDHKQLGPVFNSQHTERLGFSTSLMERVLLQDQYKQNSTYNSDLAIKLVKNFRSHRDILKFSSDQFYNGDLKACQSSEIANFAIGSDLLPNRNFPVLFHSIFGASEKKGTSIYNMTELHKTKYYVEVLLKYGINGQQVNPCDIGIICPYNAQRMKLKKLFGDEIEIGTVEYYQGREKKIIIFSAVRSQTTTIGFLNNEKRLNVALTRAKSLLIVMGNPETLCRNHHWREFIRYCKDNKAVVGFIPEESLRKPAEQLDAEDSYEEDIHDLTLEEMFNKMGIAE